MTSWSTKWQKTSWWLGAQTEFSRNTWIQYRKLQNVSKCPVTLPRHFNDVGHPGMWIGNDSSHCFTAFYGYGFRSPLTSAKFSTTSHMSNVRLAHGGKQAMPPPILFHLGIGDQHPTHLCTEVFVMDAQASNAAALEPFTAEETSGRGGPWTPRSETQLQISGTNSWVIVSQNLRVLGMFTSRS